MIPNIIHLLIPIATLLSSPSQTTAASLPQSPAADSIRSSLPVESTSHTLPQKREIHTRENRIKPEFAIKTNPLLWMITDMNIEGEIFFNPHISASLNLIWCPWFLSQKFAVRTFALLPEARWWLHDNESGHFFGLHLNLAWYNLRMGNYRYQDSSTPLLGAGVTYGYKFRLTENWGIELGIGAGYNYLRYDRFHNIDNGALIDTRKTSYFGIDRLTLSISYKFK